LHEADFAIINRIDDFAKAELDELAELIRAELPDVPVLRLSAPTGEGFEELLEMLDQQGPLGQRILDIDYDI
jgi:Ni2+-binding GTPase involved in maturation of urease and hydrogenase